MISSYTERLCSWHKTYAYSISFNSILCQNVKGTCNQTTYFSSGKPFPELYIVQGIRYSRKYGKLWQFHHLKGFLMPACTYTTSSWLKWKFTTSEAYSLAQAILNAANVANLKMKNECILWLSDSLSTFCATPLLLTQCPVGKIPVKSQTRGVLIQFISVKHMLIPAISALLHDRQHFWDFLAAVERDTRALTSAVVCFCPAATSQSDSQHMERWNLVTQ